MLEILINGEKVTAASDNLMALLEERFSQADKFAVAVNQVFIPRADYDNYRLSSGDQLELVMPMSGG